MAKRVDANQAEIVAALREMGASVFDLHEVGHGCPDILVGYKGYTCLMEIKTPGKFLSKRQEDWFDEWYGEVYVIHSVDAAISHLARLCE